jgi:hypothetical protein
MSAPARREGRSSGETPDAKARRRLSFPTGVGNVRAHIGPERLEPAINPLIPPAEPAHATRRIYGPPDVLESYQDAVAVRAIYGPASPAWWCLRSSCCTRREWASRAPTPARTRNTTISTSAMVSAARHRAVHRERPVPHHLTSLARRSDDPFNRTTRAERAISPCTGRDAARLRPGAGSDHLELDRGRARRE